MGQNLKTTEEEAAAKRRPSRNSRPAASADAQTVQQVIDFLGIKCWDLLFFADGSGTGWSDACGYAGVLIDKLTREYSLYSGALNAGSINLAEFLPYLHGMTWYHANVGRKRIEARSGVLYVHIITDSKVTVEHGRQACDLSQPLPKVQQALWASFREFCRLGYNFSFHWQERSSSLMNQCCDLVASLARRSLLNTGKGSAPVRHRENLLDAEKSLRRLLRSGAPESVRPTVEAGLRALQLLLFDDLTYAGQLATALAEARLTDPLTMQPLDVKVVDGDSVTATPEEAA